MKDNEYAYYWDGDHAVVFNNITSQIVLPRESVVFNKATMTSVPKSDIPGRTHVPAVIVEDLKYRPYHVVRVDARAIQAVDAFAIDFDDIKVTGQGSNTKFDQRIEINDGGNIGLKQVVMYKDAVGCKKVECLWRTLPKRNDFDIDEEDDNIIKIYQEIASKDNSQNGFLRRHWCLLLESFNHSKAMLNSIFLQLKINYQLGIEVTDTQLCLSELVYQLFEANLVETAQFTLALSTTGTPPLEGVIFSDHLLHNLLSKYLTVRVGTMEADEVSDMTEG